MGELIGDGGHGKVYECKLRGHEEDDDSGLCVKTVPIAHSESERKVMFQQNELNILLRVTHPNIIKIFKIYQDP
jgi:hypothetical protein